MMKPRRKTKTNRPKSRSINGKYTTITPKRKKIIQHVKVSKAKPFYREYREILRSNASQQTNGIAKLQTEDVYLQLDEVSFEFGPPELDRHDVVYKALRNVCQGKKKIQVPGLEKPEHTFHIYSNTRNDIKKICLDVFNSEPTSRKLKLRVKMSKDTISILYIDDKASQSKKFVSAVRRVVKHNAHNPSVYVVCNCLLNKDFESCLKAAIKATNIIVGISDISSIYDKCYYLLEEKTRTLLSKLRKTSDSTDERIRTVLGLQAKLEKRKHNMDVKLPESCIKTLEKSCTLKHGIIGYMKTTDAVTLLVNESHKNDQKISDLEKKLSKNMPNLGIPSLLFRPQIHIVPGEKVYGTEERYPYGTLGIFGSFQGKDVAITGAHVISATSPAYIVIDDRFVKIGNSIWPGSVAGWSDIFNISVIPINDDAQRTLELREGVEQVHVYSNRLSSLPNRKVFKVGGETGRTIGRIMEADFGFGEEKDAVLVIPEVGSEAGLFSGEGDSGSIVFTKFGTNLFALGVVFGGEVQQSDAHAPNFSTLVVNFRNALETFIQSNGILKLKKV